MSTTLFVLAVLIPVTLAIYLTRSYYLKKLVELEDVHQYEIAFANSRRYELGYEHGKEDEIKRRIKTDETVVIYPH
jgi:hypothetical protein